MDIADGGWTDQERRIVSDAMSVLAGGKAVNMTRMIGINGALATLDDLKEAVQKAIQRAREAEAATRAARGNLEDLEDLLKSFISISLVLADPESEKEGNDASNA
jgi:hypothetical protein